MVYYTIANTCSAASFSLWWTKRLSLLDRHKTGQSMPSFITLLDTIHQVNVLFVAARTYSASIIIMMLPRTYLLQCHLIIIIVCQSLIMIWCDSNCVLFSIIFSLSLSSCSCFYLLSLWQRDETLVRLINFISSQLFVCVCVAQFWLINGTSEVNEVIIK